MLSRNNATGRQICSIGRNRGNDSRTVGYCLNNSRTISVRTYPSYFFITRFPFNLFIACIYWRNHTRKNLWFSLFQSNRILTRLYTWNKGIYGYITRWRQVTSVVVTVTWIVPLATANIVAEPLSLTITRTISSSPNFHITRFSVASSGKIEHVNIKITIPYNIYYTYHFLKQSVLINQHRPRHFI